MHLTATQIAEYCGGHLVGDAFARHATRLVWDSREDCTDALYVALVGQRVDGHDFCQQAANLGAACILVTRELSEDVLDALRNAQTSVVVVEDAYDALFQLTAKWRSHLHGSVVALTGSSGKTTTKNMVRDVLAQSGSVVATQGNQNNELGVPATILAAHENTDYVIVEMGMRGQGQLYKLCELVQPTHALVTNVGTSHIELLGSVEAIVQAKAEMLQFINAPGGKAFLNASGPYVEQLISFGGLKQRGVEIIFFDGTGEAQSSSGYPVSVYASNLTYNQAGNPTFTLHIPGAHALCTLNLAGRHNVQNAVAAAAVGAEFGIEINRIVEALERAVPEQGRQSILQAPNGALVVDDSYNANPDSMCASLDAFRQMDVAGKRIAVLGSMLELGEYAEEGHCLVGHAAANSNLGLLVCVGSEAKIIARAAQDAGMPKDSIVCVDGAQDAAHYIESFVHPEDGVLVKASHSVGLVQVVERLVG